MYLFFLSSNNNSSNIETYIKNFHKATVGYSVAMFVLGVGDRHNDNMMLKKDTGQVTILFFFVLFFCLWYNWNLFQKTIWKCYCQVYNCLRSFLLVTMEMLEMKANLVHYLLVQWTLTKDFWSGLYRYSFRTKSLWLKNFFTIYIYILIYSSYSYI